MKQAILILGFCTLLCAAQMDVDLKNMTDIKDDTINVPDQPTLAPVFPTTKATTSTTSTTTTTTTTSKPTTPEPTTPKTTTPTTPKPTTPTTKPTTTAAPITTIAPPITTTPVPEPAIGVWNSSCILLKMAIQLNFSYESKENKTVWGIYNIPSNAKVEDVDCKQSNVTQTIVINWGPAEAQHSMRFQFEQNKTIFVSMISFKLPLDAAHFPDAKDNHTLQLIHRGREFNAPLKMSYHCTRAQTLNLTDTVADPTVIGTVILRNVQIEAFRNDNSTQFSSAHDCDSSETSDLVPIAVGIALVALITIVLISYLCARRRSTSRGYMSF